MRIQKVAPAVSAALFQSDPKAGENAVSRFHSVQILRLALFGHGTLG